jgi:outer membrane protein insertion porin family
MSVTFKVAEAPRVYVERLDINGNTNTRDKVIRREFRLAEGDPFNSLRVKRSQDRIQSLGFFQDKLEVTQEQGSGPDRVILGVDVEEKATGQLQLSAGFSSLERFLVNLSIQQRNFMGKGQELRASLNYSTYSKSLELGFTEPYLFDRNIAVGVDLYRRDLSNFNFARGNNRNTTFEQTTTGGQLRTGVPITEYISLAGRYSLNLDEVTLDRNVFFSDPDGGGPLPAVCDPLRAGRYLCDAVGDRTTSSIGYSLVYSNLNNGLRPTRGSGLSEPGFRRSRRRDRQYLRHRAISVQIFRGVRLRPLDHAEGGYIHSFEDGARIDPFASPTASTWRAADPRLRHPRRRPARAPHSYRTERHPREETPDQRRRLAAALLSRRAPSSRFRSATPGRELGLAVDVRRCGRFVRPPGAAAAQHSVLQPGPGHHRNPHVGPLRHGLPHRVHRRSGFREVYRGDSPNHVFRWRRR